MIKIKICGLKTETDIDYVNILRPDMAGFVFVPDSTRAVSREQATKMKRKLENGILAVGVFADAPPEMAADYVKEGIIDVIQLHGRESEDYIRRLKSMTKARIMKAFSMTGPEDIIQARASSADIILLDSVRGGSGECFDWALVKNAGRPFFLAGGLTPDNVREAIRHTGCSGVDVSSGVETAGIKDYKKMQKFVKTVRDVQQKEIAI